MKSDRKRTIIFIIILLVLSMGIGYAFLTTTLSIDGTSDIDSASWDVHFENIQETEWSGLAAEQIISPATISADGQTVSYHIKLDDPGDIYEFSVDVVNDGSLDAVIDNLLFSINDEPATIAPGYLVQYVTLENYQPFAIGRILRSGQSIKLLVGIGYNYDVEPSDLPSENQSLTISFGVSTSQAKKGTYVYSLSRSTFQLGESLPSDVVLYDSPESAMNGFAEDTFIRYKVVNDRVFEKAIGFSYNGELYYLVGGDSGASHNSNKTLLSSIFGEENCQENSQYYYSCRGNNWTAYSYTSGDLQVSKSDLGCIINGNLAACEYLGE